MKHNKIYSKNPSSKTNSITVISLLSALSTILFFVGRIPVIIAFPHIKIDFSDIPALVGALTISPQAGLTIEFIKSFIHLFNTHTLGIGELISWLIGSSMILSFCFTYKITNQKFSYKISVLSSYLVCMFCTLLTALISNAIFFPLFLKIFSHVKISHFVMTSYLVSVLVINFLKTSCTVLTSFLLLKNKLSPKTKS